MKIISGFVSNSSSSSFIVGFSKMPQSAEDLQKTLFGDENFGDEEIVVFYDESMETSEIAKRVYADMVEQVPATTEKIDEEIRSGYFDGHPDYNYGDRESDFLRRDFYQKYPSKHYMGDDYEKLDPVGKELAIKIRETIHREHEEYKKKWEEAATSYSEKVVMPKLANKMVYIFEYADNSGESVMEHGNIFKKLPHVRISKH